MNTLVNTAKVKDRRKLWFDSISDCIEEVDRITAADSQGQLKAIGNWSPGEVMSHLANWIDYSYEGYPLGSPPFFVKWILRWQLSGVLAKGMKPGAKIPGVPGGTMGVDQLSTQDAATKLKASLARLENFNDAEFDNPGFGKMSHEDRIRLNLRHAELHLSFLVYS